MRILAPFFRCVFFGRRNRGAGTRQPIRRIESLDSRLALCVAGGSILQAPVPAAAETIDFGAAIRATVAPTPVAAPPLLAPNGLPLLESRPAAPVAIFLDFDGYSGAGFSGPLSLSSYNVDGDATTFSSQEQANILEGWKRVAAHFAAFDVNVTTTLPSVPFSWSVITPSVTNGSSWGKFNGGAPSAINPQGDLLNRTSAILHEIGHNFGLAHQAAFDALGNQTDEYRNAIDALHAPIMGADHDGLVPKWVIGHPAGLPDRLQDNVAVLAAKIKSFESQGGDGFVPDDHGSTIAVAEAMTVAGNFRSASGIIERLGDIDVFSFVASGGGLSIQATPESLSPVDLKLEVFSTNGTLLAASDVASNEQQLLMSLTAGTYYVAVSSHGDYDDLGPYSLAVAPASAPSDPTPQLNMLPAPGNLVASATVNRGVHLAWSDIAGETGYSIERSANGITFAVIGSTAANVTTFDDVAPENHQRYFYRVRSANAGGVSVASQTASGLTRAGAVSNVSIMSLGETQLVVDWRDIAGDQGYRVERSADGNPFVAIATVAANVPSITDSGLQAGHTYQYRIVTLEDLGDAGTSSVATGTTRPAAINDLVVTDAGADHLSLTWSPVDGASEYLLYRSSDTLNYSMAGTVGPGVTAFVDHSISPLSEYYYYVQAMNGAIPGSVALPISAATPGGALPTPWIGQSIGSPSHAWSSAAGEANGAFTLISGTRTTDPTADALFYVNRTLHGDGEIVARVTDLEPTLDLSEVGLVIRESLAPGAKSVAITTTPFSGDRITTRSATSGMSLAETVGFGGPMWLKLQRTGNVFRAFTSNDGAAWSQAGHDVVIDMPSNVLIGMAAMGNSEFNLYSATFDNLSVVSSPIDGDFSGDGHVTVVDIDLLLTALASNNGNARFDLTNDGLTTRADLDRLVNNLVETTLGVGTQFGDLNLDGRVDRHDARLFINRFGTVAASAWENGDFNATGATDLMDLAILQSNLSSPAGSAAASALVAVRPVDAIHIAPRRSAADRTSQAAPSISETNLQATGASRRTRTPSRQRATLDAHYVDLAVGDSIARSTRDRSAIER